MPDITPELCAQVVGASLSHLVSLVEKNGRFIYAHQAGNVGVVGTGYNVLRHCGTLWFMSRAVNELPQRPDAELLDTLARSAAYIGKKLQPPAWARPEHPSLALVTKGAVKLGGLGLALLAFTEAARIPGLRAGLEKGLPHPLAETIAQMRQYALDEIEGEDFRHKRDLLTGEVLPFRSDYYTGEAIFGLLMSGPATEALSQVTASLMRRGYGWAEQSHWMAYASCEAIERGTVSEGLGRDYLTGLVHAILTRPVYRERRESTPTACRSEALSRVLLLCRSRPGYLNKDLLSRAKAHLVQDLATQLDWYREGQFWKGDASDMVQIDYIQHNATGFLQWLHLNRNNA